MDSFAATKPQRRYELDWLRVLTMLTVFLFHNALFFSVGDWHVKNTQHSLVFTIFVYCANQLIMPIFFLLAGASTRFSLDFKTGAAYVKERFLRLMIPFIFGALVLIPPQGYVEALSRFQFSGNFIQYFPHHFAIRLSRFSLNPGWLFGSFGTHLWFLGFLFLYSLVALPLFKWFYRAKGRLFIDRFAAFMVRPYAVLLLILPTALVQVVLRARFPSYLDVADLLYWFVIFICGYLIYADSRIVDAVSRHGRFALNIGIFCFVAMFFLYLFGPLGQWETNPDYSIGYLLYQVLRSVNTWAWIFVLLSLGSRRLNFSNQTLQYTNEAVLPFYIPHQTVILLIGFFVVQWPIGIPLKYLIISTSSFTITITFYELVKRFNVTRFLFGMRPKKSSGSTGAGLQVES